MGAWLDVNGESIFKTRNREVSRQKNADQELYFTRKADDLFCIFTHWSNSITIDLLETELN